MPGRAPTSTKPELSKPEKKTDRNTKPKTATAQSRPVIKTATEEQAAKTQAPTAVQPVEPEDAYLTGVSRSLQRRLLGLNVDGARPQAKPIPEATSPGLHSTGSYTETQGVKPSVSKPSKSTRKK